LKVKRRDLRGLPNPNIYKHIADAIRSLKKAEEVYAQCDIETIEGFFDPSEGESSLKRKKRKILDELHESTKRYCGIEARLDSDFRSRWLICRALIPLSMVSGVSAKAIIFGKKEYSDERRLLIWLAREAFDLANLEIASVMNRSEQSTARMYSQAIRLIGYGDSKLNTLLQDFFVAEDDICHYLKLYRQRGLE
jgi:hypothetical protein